MSNWYVKIAFPLSPDAWDKHENTHRLRKDLPAVNTMFGRIPQKLRPQEELEKDYRGVHVTKDINIAAVYANGIASIDDPPVVLEIATNQRYEHDIDAIEDGLDFGIIAGWIEDYLDYDIVEKIKEDLGNGIDLYEIIEEIMQDISNIEIYNDSMSESFDFSDQLYQSGRNINPSALIEYFEDYYRHENSTKAFYEKFILPMYYGEGSPDMNIIAYMINQMRFMNDVPDTEIVSIYTFDKYKEGEIGDAYMEDYEEYNEEGEYVPTIEDLDYGLNVKKVWQNPQLELLPEYFDIYYHGTTVSRAKMALPGLSRILDNIKK